MGGGVWAKTKRDFTHLKGLIEAGAGPVTRQEPAKGHTKPLSKGDSCMATTMFSARALLQTKCFWKSASYGK